MPYPISPYQDETNQYSDWHLDPLKVELKEKFLHHGLVLINHDDQSFWEPNHYQIFNSRFNLLYKKGKLLLFKEQGDVTSNNWLLISLDSDLNALGVKSLVGRLLSAEEFRTVVGSVASWRKISTDLEEKSMISESNFTYIGF